MLDVYVWRVYGMVSIFIVFILNLSIFIMVGSELNCRVYLVMGFLFYWLVGNSLVSWEFRLWLLFFGLMVHRSDW